MTAFQWTDVNGVVWDLGGGPVALMPGVIGLGFGAVEQYSRSSAALAGQRLTDTRALPRSVFWPLAISGDSPAAWFSTQRQFYAGLDDERTGVFQVTGRDGGVRTIALRLSSPDQQVFDSDPELFSREVVGLDLVADDPFWRGPQVLNTFQTAEDAKPFFESGPTHVLNLMSSSTVGSATVSNPGEVDAWPVWTVTGPATEFSLGAGGPVISASMTIRADQYLQISSDPTVQLARLFTGESSVLVPFSAFTSIQFARIPRGGSVPLSVVLQGNGSVSVSFYPGFRRAF